MKKKSKFILLLHRGIYNNLNIPENSMKSFKRAINSNVSIELDIHLTKDNKLVVFHDDNLIRMDWIFIKKLENVCMMNSLIYHFLNLKFSQTIIKRFFFCQIFNFYLAYLPYFLIYLIHRVIIQ